MKKITKNKKAAFGILGAVVLLLGVMFAAIIGAVVFFEFGQAAYTAQEHNETFTVANNSFVNVTVNFLPASGTVNVSWHNASDGSWNWAASADIDADGRVIEIDGRMNWQDSVRVVYEDMGHDTTESVITYAVIVFAMVALVPLILIGGIMLRSLGLFSGGGKGV